MVLDDIKKKYTFIANSEDIPDHIRSLFACCLTSQISDIETLRFIYDVKDDISPELADAYRFFVNKGASLKWFMLIHTIYEEKIEDPMPYVELFETSYEKGLDIDDLDECQKNSSSFMEFKNLVEKIMPEDTPMQKETKAFESAEKLSRKEPVLKQTEVLGENFEVLALKKENSSLSQMLDSQMQEISKLRMEILGLQKEGFEFKKSSLLFENELQSLKKENKQLSLSNRMIGKKLISVQNLSESLKKINEEISSDLEEAITSRDSMEDKPDPEEISRLIAEIEEKNAKIKEIKDKLEETHIEIEDIRDKYQNTLADKTVLEATNTQLNEEKSSIEKQYESLFVENKELQSNYKILKEEYDRLEAKVSSGEIQRMDQSPMYIPEEEYVNDDFIRDVNEELHSASASEDGIDEELTPTEVLSGLSSGSEKKDLRSLFARLIKRFKDREFTRLPIHEQEGAIFTKLVELEYPKRTMKIIGDTLKRNKKMERVELYHMIERNVSPDECEKYCMSISAA